ncbi:DUF5753 domain-containing protein [Micromonospora chokoriensis]
MGVGLPATPKELEWSAPRIWRYETGQVPVHPNDVAAMCRVYNASPETIETMRAVPRAPRLDVILNEAVLRRPLRDRAAMVRQLESLVVSSRQPTIGIRVLPFDAGLVRWAQTGTFTMLDFPSEVRQPEPTTIYMDGPCGAVYLDKTHEIEIYDDAWRSLSERALSADESRELIAAIAKEMTDGA